VTILRTKPSDTEHVACDVCLKEIPRSEAIVPEATDYVLRFCGLECYEKWKTQLGTPEEFAAGAARRKASQPAGPEPQVQLGHERGSAKDERVKQLIRRHPQRDEPRLDSVEPFEVPPE